MKGRGRARGCSTIYLQRQKSTPSLCTKKYPKKGTIKIQTAVMHSLSNKVCVCVCPRTWGFNGSRRSGRTLSTSKKKKAKHSAQTARTVSLCVRSLRAGSAAERQHLLVLVALPLTPLAASQDHNCHNVPGVLFLQISFLLSFFLVPVALLLLVLHSPQASYLYSALEMEGTLSCEMSAQE